MDQELHVREISLLVGLGRASSVGSSQFELVEGERVADYVRPHTPRAGHTLATVWPVELAHRQEGRAPAPHSKLLPLSFSFSLEHNQGGAPSHCHTTTTPPCPLAAVVVPPSDFSRQ
jgi:hypothetical protein